MASRRGWVLGLGLGWRGGVGIMVVEFEGGDGGSEW